MKLIAIRHGETEWNVEHRKMGHLDSPLTQVGVRQANAIAYRLGPIKLAAIYSSDLGRAVRTAEHIAARCGLEVRLEEALRERSLGIFEGLTRDEARQRYPQEIANLKQNRFTYVVPNGESAKDRLDRSVRILNSIAERHPDEQVVVVTHSGPLKGFLEYVLEMPPGNGRNCSLQNASYNVFNYADGKWSLETWNDTSHLAALKH